MLPLHFSELCIEWSVVGTAVIFVHQLFVLFWFRRRGYKLGFTKIVTSDLDICYHFLRALSVVKLKD